MTRNYYIQLLIVAIGCLLWTASCKKDEPAEPEPTPSVNITITATPQSLTLPATGGTQTITVTASIADWTAVSDAPWLTVTKETATSAGLDAGVNAGAAHSTTVRFIAGTVTATITVSQQQLTVIQRDSVALADLYHAAAGAGWTSRWTLSSPLSQWPGVTVENGRVTELKLPSNNLTGTLPESIGNLTVLEYCDLSGNQLNGNVPATIGNLTQLTYLDLWKNDLSGALPSLNTASKLVVLDMSDNSFSALPSLNRLTDLEYLAFSTNNLSGNLPDNWSSLEKLIYLDGSFNNFSGTLPDSWSALVKMEAFCFYGNTLEGSIPRYLGDFSKLQTLALDGNNLTGTVPDNLGTQPTLEELWLAQNRLTGNLPTSLLGNPHWNGWRSNVCPQQDNYGFDNCTTAGDQPRPGGKIAMPKNKYKEKYRR
jgi:hypothetical protein